jgi:hypothetical protein
LRIRLLILLFLSGSVTAGQFADLAPLLQEHCIKCHGGAKQKGGLDLRSLESLLRGGDNGPALLPGKPDQSPIFTYLDAGADPHMPPKGQLSEGEIDKVGDWITHFTHPEEADSGTKESDALQALPAELSPESAIDTLLERSWQKQQVSPAATIGDGPFLRRVTLDLLGRIPTSDERTSFLANENSNKRSLLIDNLLASKAHARHFAEIFNAALLGRAQENGKSRADREKHFLPYLRWAFETNRPWNRVGHDFIVARPQSSQEQGASWFLYEQENDPGKMANATATALFGKQLQCAQCHDHPVAPEIEQRHYWGMVAFFDRTRNVTTSQGPGLGERAAGGYNKFANLEGESSESELVFLTGQTVQEPGGRRDKDHSEHYHVAPPADWINPPKPKKKGEKPKLTTNVEKAPFPKFSRRGELARLAIETNPDFPRALVNRLWAILMGRGIVHPVDKMNSAHPPSHPELLDWLARDFAANGFDVRRMCRAVLSSRAYSLSTIHPDKVPPVAESFARGLDKPLPAEALYRSILVALGGAVKEDGTVEHESNYRGAFVSTYPDIFAEVFSPSVQQAMFAANGDVLDSILKTEELPLPLQLDGNPDNREVTEELFLAVLGRAPDPKELARTTSYLQNRTDRRAPAIRQILWALFNSAEFRMNH